MLSNNEPYPVRAICRVLDLPRSTYYHRSKESDDLRQREAIEAIVQEFPTYGSRRVTKQLRRSPYNIRVNRKRIQRLLREMGLQQPQKRLTCRTTNSCHAYPRYPNLVKELSVTFPDQVWVSDITYIRLQSEFIYLAVIMDVFTRSIRGWQLSRSLDQQLTLTALKRALSDHVPLIHHSDQGGQYAATAYTDLLTSHGVQISMATEGVPEENGYAERLIRTIKEEEVDLSEYYDFADALTQIGYFIEQVYQYKRIHSALGYLTPMEFEAAWHQSQIEQESLKPV
jgi:transposase InsO family protein